MDVAPPMRPSDAADDRQLAMAATEGEAYERALEHMVMDVAADGAEVRAGDYIIGYAIADAEGTYFMEDGQLAWLEPEGTVHLAITIRDGADGRFIPGLLVRATLLDSEGREVATHVHPFVWHPWLYHYGRNWEASEGEYMLKVLVDPPHFPRHDRENGQRYATAVEASFMIRVRSRR